MASQKTKFNVGLFVACGIAVAIVAVIWLGMTHLFEKRHNYVTYFNESVQGLDMDSPVKYRGVAIGRVENISVAPDSKLIEVVLQIESGQELDADTVAQLKAVGITGSMFVELDLKKEGQEGFIPDPNRFPFKHKVVPSRPSNISELLQGIDDVLKHIKSLDLSGISDKIKLTLENLNKAMAEADVKGVSQNIQSSLDNVDRILSDPRLDNILASMDDATKSLSALMLKSDRIVDAGEKTLGKVEGIIEEKKDAVKSAIDGFREAMQNTNRFLEKATFLADSADESRTHLVRHLLVVGQNLEKASENLNRLIETLADQPSQLLFGEPPVPRNVEPEVHKKD